MNVRISDFGDILVSRPAGRDAFLGAKAYFFQTIDPSEPLILDFTGVKVLAPSWADEFITGIQASFTNTIECIHTENPSVAASLKTIFT